MNLYHNGNIKKLCKNISFSRVGGDIERDCNVQGLDLGLDFPAFMLLIWPGDRFRVGIFAGSPLARDLGTLKLITSCLFG